MSQPESYRPGQLSLSKKQILGIIDELQKDWMSNKSENWKYIIEAKAIKILFGQVPEDKFPYFWDRFWEKADALYLKNAVAQDETLQKVFATKDVPLVDLMPESLK